MREKDTVSFEPGCVSSTVELSGFHVVWLLGILLLLRLTLGLTRHLHVARALLLTWQGQGPSHRLLWHVGCLNCCACRLAILLRDKVLSSLSSHRIDTLANRRIAIDRIVLCAAIVLRFRFDLHTSVVGCLDLRCAGSRRGCSLGGVRWQSRRIGELGLLWDRVPRAMRNIELGQVLLPLLSKKSASHFSQRAEVVLVQRDQGARRHGHHMT